MAKMETVTIVREIAAPASEAYRAFTSGSGLREWFADGAEVRAQPGGHLYLWHNNGTHVEGRFTRLEPHNCIEYTALVSGDPAPTHVQAEIEEKGKGSRVTVTHGAIGTGNRWVGVRERLQKSWEDALENLQSVLETGDDLRFTMRPMLGIMGVNDLEADEAAKLGVKGGIRIDGTVEGMGAAKAGLTKDDVLVTMDGQAVIDYPSLADVLGRHRAGDSVRVEYFRGGKKEAVTMELSKRPLVAVPNDPDELAKQLQAKLAEHHGRLAKLFEGVSEAQASYHPGEGEWSAKEVIAHLIHEHRDNQILLMSLVGGLETRDFPPNHRIYVKATADAYQTVGGLLEQLSRTEQETVAIAASLPAEFAARKGSYVRMGRTLLDNTLHINDHADQIANAIKAAG